MDVRGLVQLGGDHRVLHLPRGGAAGELAQLSAQSDARREGAEKPRFAAADGGGTCGGGRWIEVCGGRGGGCGEARGLEMVGVEGHGRMKRK